MLEAVKIFSYEGQPVTFKNENGTVYVNATEMAKRFGKMTHEYLRLPNTIELIKELSNSLKISDEGNPLTLIIRQLKRSLRTLRSVKQRKYFF
jgi:hypothetical protein